MAYNSEIKKEKILFEDSPESYLSDPLIDKRRDMRKTKTYRDKFGLNERKFLPTPYNRNDKERNSILENKPKTVRNLPRFDLKTSTNNFPNVLAGVKLNSCNSLQFQSMSTIKIIFFFFTTLIISSIQLITFRIIASLSNYELPITFTDGMLNDFKVYSWRIQGILLILFAYYLLISLMRGKTTNPPPIYLNLYDDRQNFDLIDILANVKLNWTEIVTIKNLRHASIHIICSFLIFYSTKFIQFSICALFNNLGIVLFFLNLDNRIKKRTISYGDEDPSNKRTIQILSAIFILLGLSSVIYSLLVYDFDSFNILIGLGLSFSSSLINFFFQTKEIKINLETTSPFQLIFSLYLNSFLISLLFFLSLQAILNKVNIIHFVMWIFDYQLLIFVGVGFALLGLVHILLTMIISFKFDQRHMKLLKYFEIPLNDVFGCIAFNLYTVPLGFVYVLGIFQCLVGLFIADYYDIMLNNSI